MQWIEETLRRFRFLLQRKQLANELEEEIKLHLLLRTEEGDRMNVQKKFGNKTRICEESREVWGWRVLDTLGQDLRYAWRTLRRSPGFTITAVLTLALGLGANAAIFNLLYTVLLKGLPVPAAEELQIVGIDNADNESIFSYPCFRDMQKAAEAHVSIAAYSSNQKKQTYLGRSEPEMLEVQLVSGSFFPTLRVKAELGRTLTEQDEGVEPHRSGVISYSLWTSRFGKDPGVLGREIMVQTVPVTIVGVAARSFHGIGQSAEPGLWAPLSLQQEMKYRRNFFSLNGDDGKSFLPQREIQWLGLMARVPLSVSASAVQGALNSNYHADLNYLAKLIPDPRERRDFVVKNVVLQPGGKGLGDVRKSFSKPLISLMAAVALVLLIACANIASLSLARSTAREKELALRASIGASRTRIVRQLLTENLVISFIGGAVSIPIAYVTFKGLLRWASKGPNLVLADLGMGWPLIGFTFTMALITGLLFGLIPALSATSVPIAETLKAQARTVVQSRLPWGRTLIASQVALTFVLLAGAGLFLRTLMNYTNFDMGFRPAQVLSISIDTLSAGYSEQQLGPLYQRIKQEVEMLPGVDSVAFGACGVAENCQGISRITLFTNGNQRQRLQENTVSPGYFQTIGIPLLQGRSFTEQDTQKTPLLAVINQTMARHYFPGKNPIGQRYGYGNDPDDTKMEIIGVIGDAYVNDIHQPVKEMAYYSLRQQMSNVSTVEVRAAPTAIKTLGNQVRRSIRNVDPKLPVTKVTPLALRVSDNLSRERLLSHLAIAFSILALTLSCVGVYGVLSYQMTLRTTEVGIRLALGARPANVRWLVLREAFMVVLAGAIIGIPASLGTARLAESLLFGLSSADPLSLTAAFTILLFFALLAALLPAWRASRVDPMIALRAN